MAVAEGIPLDTPPGLVVEGVKLRLEHERQMNIALSVSIITGIGMMLGGGGDTDAIRRPFYTAKEWSEMEAQTAAMREEFAQRQQLAKIRRLMGGQDGR